MFSLEKMTEAIVMSSRDPEKLSLTFAGILVQFVPVIMLVLLAFGVSTVESDIVAIIENITQLVATAMAAIGLLMSTWGMIRKLFKPVDLSEFTE